MGTFGSRTIELRKALGLTQAEFSTAGDLSQSNLSNAENDKTLPNTDFVMNIKTKFPKIDLNWWLCGQGHMFNLEFERKSLPNNINPAIKEFLEDMRNEMAKINMTRNYIEVNKKKG